MIYLKDLLFNNGQRTTSHISRRASKGIYPTSLNSRLVDLTGKEAEKVLERAGLTCNKNAIPNDPRSPFVTSGLRFGTPAGTTRGFGVKEFEQIGNWVCDCLEGFVKNGEDGNAALEKKIRAEVKELCGRFPIY